MLLLHSPKTVPRFTSNLKPQPSTSMASRSSISSSPVQVERSTDQSQMTERLRRIPQLLSGPRDLLAEHAQVVPEAQHVLEDVDGAREVLLLANRQGGSVVNQKDLVMVLERGRGLGTWDLGLTRRRLWSRPRRARTCTWKKRPPCRRHRRGNALCRSDTRGRCW